MISRKYKNTGKFSLVVFSILIYFRGYLVPGTPELTKRYLPDKILQYFEHHPPVPSSSTISSSSVDSKSSKSTDETLNPEKLLTQLDIVKECDDEDDLCLTDEFERSWDEKIKSVEQYEMSTETSCAILDLSENNHELVEFDNGFTLVAQDSTVGQWPSKGALIADMATAELVSQQFPYWEQTSLDEKLSVLRSVRVFVTHFPTTGAPVTISEETFESCCRSVEVVAIQCSETGQRLIEQPIE